MDLDCIYTNISARSGFDCIYTNFLCIITNTTENWRERCIEKCRSFTETFRLGWKDAERVGGDPTKNGNFTIGKLVLLCRKKYYATQPFLRYSNCWGADVSQKCHFNEGKLAPHCHFSCYHVFILSCLHVIMSSCHHAMMTRWGRLDVDLEKF